jgi:hypothetical protein
MGGCLFRIFTLAFKRRVGAQIFNTQDTRIALGWSKWPFNMWPVEISCQTMPMVVPFAAQAFKPGLRSFLQMLSSFDTLWTLRHYGRDTFLQHYPCNSWAENLVSVGLHVAPETRPSFWLNNSLQGVYCFVFGYRHGLGGEYQ